MSGSIILQIISICCQPFLTRLYTPQDYGVFSIMQSVVAIYCVVGGLCYDRVIVITKYRTHARAVLQLTMFLYLICGGFLSILLLIPSIWYTLFNLDFTFQLWWIFIVWLICSGLLVGIVAFHNREGNFNELSIRQVKSGITSLITQLVFGSLKFSLVGLMAGVVFNVLYSIKLLYQVKYFNCSYKFNVLKSILRTYSKFPKYQLPSVILETLSLQSVVILINKLLSSNIAGQYALANKMLAIPLTIVGSAFATVFYREFAIRYNNKDKPKEFLVSIWVKLFLIGILPCGFVFLFSEKLFVIFFGLNWILAGWFAKYLCLMTFFMLISSPTSTAFIIMGLHKYQLYFSLIIFITRIIAVFIMSLSLFYGVMFLIITEIIALIIYNYSIVNCLKNRINFTGTYI